MPYLITVLIVIVLSLGGAYKAYTSVRGIGYAARDASCTEEKAVLNRKVAFFESEKMEAERQAYAVKEKSRIQIDRMAEAAAKLEEKLTNVSKRHRDEIIRLTSAHRVVLRRELTSLLNRQSRITESSTGETAAPSGAPDEASAGPPADSDRRGGGTSERALALWKEQIDTMWAKAQAERKQWIKYGNEVSQ